MGAPPVDAGDDAAIVGVRARAVVVPHSVAEAAEIIGERTRAGEALAFVGGGTELELGAAPRRLDTIVRTTSLGRLVEHAPADQIVSVEAGMTLAALQATLAAHRQRVALDPPAPARATIGGLVATNAFGPLRTRYGSLRDLCIGASFVRADGTLVKGGGKVVKNVAGFDLPKLLIGSLGTLGMIATVTLRLHPLPETQSTLIFAVTPTEAETLVRQIVASQLEPDAVALLLDGDGLQLLVRYEGFALGVDQQCARTLALPAGSKGGRLDDDAARQAWAREESARGAGVVRAKIAALPAKTADVVGAIVPALARALAPLSCSFYPLLGLGFVAGAGTSNGALDVAAAAAALAAARATLLQHGGTLTLTAAPPALRRDVDEWGPPPPALGLMQKLKQAFDPAGALNPGRFVAGI
jgi:glycolate oxidase FAD binding subunit